jgi:polyhydroxyalkanoate synthase
MGEGAVAASAPAPNGAANADSASQRLSDKRFASPAWRNNAPYRYTAAFYLLTARAMTELAEAVEADPKVVSASASRYRNGWMPCRRPTSWRQP